MSDQPRTLTAAEWKKEARLTWYSSEALRNAYAAYREIYDCQSLANWFEAGNSGHNRGAHLAAARDRDAGLPMAIVPELMEQPNG